ncbi:hypothetical protein BDN71DRAFT_1514192 [Pleurotus eryngii]|uniref:DUF6589 domain-containing protein n=1 Tax=Pleurotus eryngii TaxID=5323 RepID=A0A9P5ZGU0_PLEER|nr:hypothetical protein BDN71DRAFT_1514192 [Pleurotus eryngii]
MVHLVGKQLEREIISAVKKKNRLHPISYTPNTSLPTDDYGLGTFAKAQEVFERYQPIAWHYTLLLATPKAGRKRDMRPPMLVATRALSSIAFSRNSRAKLVPADFGVLLFACQANRYLHAHASHLGLVPSYDSTYRLLKKYAKHDLAVIHSLASSDTSAVIIWLDNVQTYVRLRDLRIGREAHMLTGTAATAFVIEDFSAAALNLLNKQLQLSNNLQQKLTFRQLWGMVDHAHIEVICSIQWLQTLVHYIPSLALYKPARTQIFPLPTNGQNETLLSDLAKGLREILESIGFTKDSFPERLLFIGGDGLTYERMVQLKNMLKITNENPLQSLEILEPFLEIWHTNWTNLSRIYEAHWDSLTSKDPSNLGHSANRIGRKASANLKKVDYYPFMQLAYQVLDARMLDCWRLLRCGEDSNLWNHFESLKNANQLPGFDLLYTQAKQLYQMYGSPAAYHNALNGNVNPGIPHLQPANTTEEVKGDSALARSTRFIHNTTISREAMYAAADGDIGREWQCLKYMLFTFAGSSHTKYMAYLLEFISNVELESSEPLSSCFMGNFLVNPSGLPGHFMAGDKFQEQLQDELYDSISADTEFDDNYVQNVIAPNVHRFEQIKKNIHKSLGLAKRARKHVEPHANAEIRRLLAAYQSTGLHCFVEGRSYDSDPEKVDDLG